MKKIIRYTFLFWTILLATSCVDPLEESVKTGLKGDYGISLSVICTTPPTKAGEVVVGPKAGDDNYNENKVNYVDWFIFKSESDTDNSLMHGRASVSQASSSDGLQTEGITIVPGLNLDEFVTNSQRSFYIYAIANMPGVNSHEAMPVKLADLKTLDLAPVFNVNPFSKQKNFVMRGGTTLTFADSDKGTLKTVTVELSRVAAKVSVNINVAPAIDQLTTLSTGERKYEKTWYPVLSSIQVYLSFANEETTLAGEPVTYDQSPSTFFTYNRAAFKPYYSYTGASGAPSESAPTNTPDWDNNSWKWEVTGTPFYSYPMAWTSDSPQAPFLKVILKWLSYDETPPVEEPYYVDTEDGKKFVRAKREKRSMIDAEREFYYKIPIPSETLSLEANDWYDLTFDVAILGGTTDELPVVLSGQYFVVDWNDPHIQDGSSLKQGSYLSLASDTNIYYMYGIDDISIPVLSSHDITSIIVNSATYTDFSGVTSTTATLPSTSYSTDANGRASFSLTHALTRDITSPNLDCSIIDFDVTITNAVGLKIEHIKIKQYPPIYIQSETSNECVFINGTSNQFDQQTDEYRFVTGDVAHAESGSFIQVVQDDYSAPHTYGAYNASVTFENYTNYTSNGRYYGKTMGTTRPQRAGQITVKAPEGEGLTSIVIHYLGSGSGSYAHYQNISWSSGSSTYRNGVDTWTGNGSLNSVTITSPTGNNRNTIARIDVVFTSPNQLGTIKAYNYNPVGLNNPNIYTISVSDLSQSDYDIADPRNDTPVSYPALKGGGAGDALTGYYPVNTDYHNAVAPKFKIASTHGASLSHVVTFENAQKRCASYQESGYPAGRWRVPTDAEIRFMVNLSKNRKLPSLFNGVYWGSSGVDGTRLRVEVTTEGSTITDITVTEEYNQTQASVRCVYDAWYWGDEPMSQYMTTWSGWQTN